MLFYFFTSKDASVLWHRSALTYVYWKKKSSLKFKGITIFLGGHFSLRLHTHEGPQSSAVNAQFLHIRSRLCIISKGFFKNVFYYNHGVPQGLILGYKLKHSKSMQKIPSYMSRSNNPSNSDNLLSCPEDVKCWMPQRFFQSRMMSQPRSPTHTGDRIPKYIHFSLNPCVARHSDGCSPYRFLPSLPLFRLLLKTLKTFFYVHLIPGFDFLGDVKIWNQSPAILQF